MPATLTPNPTDTALAYRGASVAILVHVVLLFGGFTVLAAVFDFPEVLRYSAAERLARYRAGQSVIQPTYWLLAMSGFTQIFMALFLYRSFRNRDATVLIGALLFGVLTGLLQTLGFIRWAILIPYLAERMADPATTAAGHETIALIEGAFNRYAGMAVGEHTANLCLALWTSLLGAAILRRPLFDRRLGWAGLALGPLAFVLALEQLGLEGNVLDLVTDFGFPAWAVWLLLLAYSLWRTDPAQGTGPRLSTRVLTGAFGLYMLMVLPTLLGG